MNDRIIYGQQIVKGVDGYLVSKYRTPIKITPHLGRSLITVTLDGLNISEINNLLKLSTRRELTARCGIDDSGLVRVGWKNKNILVEAPLPIELRKPFNADQVPVNNSGVWIGLDNFSAPVLLKTKQGKNVLVCGITQSGKTNLLKYLGYKLLEAKEQVTVLDTSPKSDSSWASFETKVKIIDQDNHAYTFLDKVCRNLSTNHRRFIIIDELATLLDNSNTMAAMLTKLTSLGYGQGVTVVCATQYASSKFLGNTTVSKNLGDRLCGMVDNAGSSYNALGLPQGGAETLSGYGDFLYRSGNNLTRIYTPLFDNGMVSLLPDQVRIDNEVENTTANLDLTEVNQKLDTIIKAVKTPQRKELNPCDLATILKEDMTISKIRSHFGWGQSRASRASKYVKELKQCLEN